MDDNLKQIVSEALALVARADSGEHAYKYLIDSHKLRLIIEGVANKASSPTQPGFVLAPEKLTSDMRYAMSGQCATHYGQLDAMYEAAINVAKKG